MRRKAYIQLPTETIRNQKFRCSVLEFKGEGSTQSLLNIDD